MRSCLCHLAEWHERAHRTILAARIEKKGECNAKVDRCLFAGRGSWPAVSTPSLDGSFRAPSLDALQQMCATTPADYGADAQSVYSAFYDAYVAERRGGLSKDRFCAFQADIAGGIAPISRIPAPRRKAPGPAFPRYARSGAQLARRSRSHVASRVVRRREEWTRRGCRVRHAARRTA